MLLQIGSAMVKLDADESSCLAIVPMGTANDFATGLGISDDPWEALQLAAHSTAHPIDVGTVNGQVGLPVCCYLSLLCAMLEENLFCLVSSELSQTLRNLFL